MAITPSGQVKFSDLRTEFRSRDRIESQGTLSQSL